MRIVRVREKRPGSYVNDSRHLDLSISQAIKQGGSQGRAKLDCKVILKDYDRINASGSRGWLWKGGVVVVGRNRQTNVLRENCGDTSSGPRLTQIQVVDGDGRWNRGSATGPLMYATA